MESGLQFDFSYAEGTSWEQMVAFETAGMIWSDYISDNMTVNIHVEMTNSLPDNVIGGALPGVLADVNYTNFRQAYENDITSTDDRDNFDNLSLIREESGGTWEKFEGLVNTGARALLETSSTLNMTRANAKALGLLNPDDSHLDGYIMMNDLSSSSLDWDYNHDWTDSNSLDFLSTAVHEVGHVLGFVSGVDSYRNSSLYDDLRSFGTFESDYDTINTFREFAGDIISYANPLDLFRYSNNSLVMGSGSNTIDMSMGGVSFFRSGQKYFHYARGKDFSLLYGDSYQASHWEYKEQDSNVQGIMDPVMKPGIFRRISNQDLTAMDAIGYNLSSRGHNLQAASGNKWWQPVTGQGTDIGILQSGAKEHIAQSISSDGQAWWIDYLAHYYPEWSSALSVDRTKEVAQMIEESEVYQGRRSSASSRGYSQLTFNQEAYFSSISEEYINPVETTNWTPVFPESLMTENMQVASEVLTVEVSSQETNPSAIDDPNQVEIVNVTMDLLSLAATQENKVTTTTSAELETELVKQEDSLFSREMMESELVMPLG